ncbi:Hypothetical protein SCLAV_4078 [Streptomyces clavuligerus]|uniref:Uncharacterized protein n=1 Tax=Streptomyces clavuligerus TaxID=1901 RepID=E2Q4Z4_STRCL|nr:Hypothetical protein SCLAV_4078 [Streptomyces clavuligerus]
MSPRTITRHRTAARGTSQHAAPQHLVARPVAPHGPTTPSHRTTGSRPAGAGDAPYPPLPLNDYAPVSAYLIKIAASGEPLK